MHLHRPGYTHPFGAVCSEACKLNPDPVSDNHHHHRRRHPVQTPSSPPNVSRTSRRARVLDHRHPEKNYQQRIGRPCPRKAVLFYRRLAVVKSRHHNGTDIIDTKCNTAQTVRNTRRRDAPRIEQAIPLGHFTENACRVMQQHRLCTCLAKPKFICCSCPFGFVCSESCGAKHAEICMSPFVLCATCDDITPPEDITTCSMCNSSVCYKKCATHTMCTRCNDAISIAASFCHLRAHLEKTSISNARARHSLLQNYKTASMIALQDTRAPQETIKKALLSLNTSS